MEERAAVKKAAKRRGITPIDIKRQVQAHRDFLKKKHGSGATLGGMARTRNTREILEGQDAARGTAGGYKPRSK